MHDCNHYSKIMKSYLILGYKKSNKKVISEFFIFFLSKWLSHINVTCQSQKKWEKLINCSHCSQKNTYFTIFANFGQLWMVVYTASYNGIFLNFSIVQDVYRCNLKIQEFWEQSYFCKKSYSEIMMGRE